MTRDTDTRGIDTAAARALLDQAVADEVFPGGVLLVADGGEVVWRHAFGRRARVPEVGPAVTLDTVYDVASVTKPIATVCVVLRLIEAGRLALDTPACAFVPELTLGGAAGAGEKNKDKEKIRVADLLAHASGLPAWEPFYERLLAGERLGAASAREAILRMACAAPLSAPPGAQSVYSDLGFIVLGFVAERAGGARLDELAARAVFAPLGMTASTFVDLEAVPRAPRPSPVAPTEICPRRGFLVGEVHDDNCHAAGGVLGHAGLFTTAEDLSRACATLVGSWRGDSVPGAFPADLVRRIWSPCGVPESTWRLGWDGPSSAPGSSQAGDHWPRDGVGHMGYTGTSIWISPAQSRWVILLTNRVHPSRADQRIKQVRPLLHDLLFP